MDPFRYVTDLHAAGQNNTSEKEECTAGVRLILPGERGPHIQMLQKKLAEKGFLSKPVTDEFDDAMGDAIMAFQLQRGIDADRKIGKETQLELLGTTIAPAITTLTSPRPEEDNFHVFGDFRIVGWWMANLVFLDLEDLRGHFDHVEGLERGGLLGFESHWLVAPHFKRAFDTIAVKGLHKKLVQYDGCFKIRYKRTSIGQGGDRDWSNHCWGIALDINSRYSPLGRPLGSNPLQVDVELAECFEEAGFFWGGRYENGVLDSMHFQYCIPTTQITPTETGRHRPEAGGQSDVTAAFMMCEEIGEGRLLSRQRKRHEENLE